KRNTLLQEIFGAGGIEERDHIFKRRSDRLLAIVAGDRVVADRRADELSKRAFVLDETSNRGVTRRPAVGPERSIIQHGSRQLLDLASGCRAADADPCLAGTEQVMRSR